ncbi:MAG: FAD-dependent oxidoreductase [Anaerocolumna sp.]
MGKEIYNPVYDVVIAGGGVSGAVSAIAAGRCGVKTIVIEQYGFLGGSLTANGVGPMMTFHAGERQVIAGIMEEIVEELVRRGYSTGHIKDTTQYISYLTPFQSEGLKIVLDEFLEKAGCKVLFHTFVGGVNITGDTIQSITVCNKDGLNDVRGKVFIDATGDGDIAAFGGAPMTKGRECDGAMQPMTMNMKYSQVNGDILKGHIEKYKEEFPRMIHNIELMKNTNRLSFAGFTKEFNQARELGEIDILREEILCFETTIKGEFIVNTTRILGFDATDCASLSKAEVVGRKQCEQLDRFLRKWIKGFKDAILEVTGPNIGVRGSRQLKGIYTLTAEDILNRKEFNTVIAHSAYPIDIHNPKGEGTQSSFISEPGTYYSIPYEVMVCEEIKNLLVTGRCVSATFEAQAAIRTTPTVGALGHACGIAAALAVKEEGITKNINVKELQKELVKQKAYLDLKNHEKNPAVKK